MTRFILLLLLTLFLSPTRRKICPPDSSEIVYEAFAKSARDLIIPSGLAQLNNLNPQLNTPLALTIPGDSYVGAIQSEGEDISLCAVSVGVLVSGPGMVGVRFSLYDANVWELEEVQNRNASALSGGIAGTTRLVFTFCNPKNPAPIKSDVPIAVVYLSLANGTEALFYRGFTTPPINIGSTPSETATSTSSDEQTETNEPTVVPTTTRRPFTTPPINIGSTPSVASTTTEEPTTASTGLL
ncbi:hypothetical protein HK104_005358 [Borealophlyctis nickersoniae]|nr:hypothetical protein HK104_005358 [Borealophlyctis nickersoniae]